MIGAFIAKKKISSAFDALNRRDFSAFLSAWGDDCVFIYPGDIAVSGKMEGKASIENWFKNFMDRFQGQKLYNTLYVLKKQGKVENPSKGVYVKG